MRITVRWRRSWGLRMERKRLPLAPLVTLFLISAFAASICVAADDGIYTQHCVACHQPDGAGMPGIAPPLRSDALKHIKPDASVYVVQVLLKGMHGATTDGFYAGVMPSWAFLSDAELAAAATYVLKLNKHRAVITADKVAEQRKVTIGRDELKALRNAS